FDGDRLARERNYLARSVAAGVGAFARARTATVASLGRIRGAGWLRGGFQDHVGYVTLGELPERMLGHDKSHAGQLGDLLGGSRGGADWRGAAIGLGFSDPRAFARAFKRWTRVTPSVFQRAPAVTRRGCA